MLEVSHVATASCPVLALQRKSPDPRRAGTGFRDENRMHDATREEVLAREVPVIAIVDDDESFRRALERFLGTFAFRVRTFASGKEFLQSSGLDSVACLLLDLVMPGMSGLEMKQELAARGLRIPTVFVTAHADDAMALYLMTAGAISILRKLVDQQMLLRLVQGVVDRHRLPDD
jgi:FixJ family two-component response regulator